MVSPSQFMNLTQGTNFVTWAIIMNSWTNGILFSSLVLGLAVILYSAMKNSGVDHWNAFTSSSFAAVLITGIGAFITWNSLTLTPLWIPLFFAILTGIGAVMCIVRR